MGADAHRAQAQLQQAQQKGGQLAVESATLAQALEQEAAVNKQNSAEIAHLEQQLQTATKQAGEASKTLEKASCVCISISLAKRDPWRKSAETAWRLTQTSECELSLKRKYTCCDMQATASMQV